jgi:uncharacterized protein (TIGR00369 family)
MNKETTLQHVKKSWLEAEVAPQKLFLFNLFDFSFSYDDENKLCRIECPITEPMYNPLGTVHGGILTYLADTAIGHLNFRFKDAPYVSIELKTSYLKASTSGKLIATARYVKDGYKVMFTECVIENENAEIVSTTSGTFYRYTKGSAK